MRQPGGSALFLLIWCSVAALCAGQNDLDNIVSALSGLQSLGELTSTWQTTTAENASSIAEPVTETRSDGTGAESNGAEPATTDLLDLWGSQQEPQSPAAPQSNSSALMQISFQDLNNLFTQWGNNTILQSPEEVKAVQVPQRIPEMDDGIDVPEPESVPAVVPSPEPEEMDISVPDLTAEMQPAPEVDLDRDQQQLQQSQFTPEIEPELDQENIDGQQVMVENEDDGIMSDNATLGEVTTPPSSPSFQQQPQPQNQSTPTPTPAPIASPLSLSLPQVNFSALLENQSPSLQVSVDQPGQGVQGQSPSPSPQSATQGNYAGGQDTGAGALQTALGQGGQQVPTSSPGSFNPDFNQIQGLNNELFGGSGSGIVTDPASTSVNSDLQGIQSAEVEPTIPPSTEDPASPDFPTFTMPTDFPSTPSQQIQGSQTSSPPVSTGFPFEIPPDAVAIPSAVIPDAGTTNSSTFPFPISTATPIPSEPANQTDLPFEIPDNATPISPTSSPLPFMTGTPIQSQPAPDFLTPVPQGPSTPSQVPSPVPQSSPLPSFPLGSGIPAQSSQVPGFTPVDSTSTLPAFLTNPQVSSDIQGGVGSNIQGGVQQNNIQGGVQQGNVQGGVQQGNIQGGVNNNNNIQGGVQQGGVSNNNNNNIQGGVQGGVSSPSLTPSPNYISTQQCGRSDSPGPGTLCGCTNQVPCGFYACMELFVKGECENPQIAEGNAEVPFGYCDVTCGRCECCPSVLTQSRNLNLTVWADMLEAVQLAAGGGMGPTTSVTQSLSNPSYTATVFVPTDEAFRKLYEEQQGQTREEFLSTIPPLQQIVQTHLLLGQVAVTAQELWDGELGYTLPTQLGGSQSAFLRIDRGTDLQSMTISSPGSTAQIVQPDVNGCLSIMHLIDEVLLPYEPENNYG